MPLKYAKPLSQAADKLAAKRLKAAQQRIVYRLVSKRDVTCRCCGGKTGLHHHHLRFRSRGGQDTESNVLLLCAVCHADLHGYRLHIIGDDARHQLTFRRTR